MLPNRKAVLLLLLLSVAADMLIANTLLLLDIALLLSLPQDDSNYVKRYKRALRKPLGALFRRRIEGHRPRSLPRYDQQRKRTYQPARTSEFDIHENTGLFKEEFDKLFDTVRERLESPRTGRRRIAVSWTTEARLLLALQYLRQYPSLTLLAQLYGSTRGTICRELHHSIPILLSAVSQRSRSLINFPSPRQLPHYPTFLGSPGVIDCTSHFRWRVHPWSCEWYRGDKHAHFFTAQVVRSLNYFFSFFSILLTTVLRRSALSVASYGTCNLGWAITTTRAC
jgi:hypothetical protein